MLINGAMRFAYHALLQSKPALDFHEAVFLFLYFAMSSLTSYTGEIPMRT